MTIRSRCTSKWRSPPLCRRCSIVLPIPTDTGATSRSARSRGNWSTGCALDDAAEIHDQDAVADVRSEEHTSELQSLMRISYAVFCLKKKKKHKETKS